MDIFMPNRAHKNVYHFFLYMLSNLRHVSITPEKIYIDLESTNNFAYEILQLLYPNTQIILSKACPVGCHSVHQDPIPKSNVRTSGVLPDAYVYVRNMLLPHIKDHSPYKRIYVSRNQDARIRHIRNEHALVSGLNKYNFNTLQFSRIPILHQMAAFHHADIIISPHGSALTHILFCRPHTRIIEICTPEQSRLEHFSHIAEVLGLNYTRYNNMEPKNKAVHIFKRNVLRLKDKMAGSLDFDHYSEILNYKSDMEFVDIDNFIDTVMSASVIKKSAARLVYS